MIQAGGSRQQAVGAQRRARLLDAGWRRAQADLVEHPCARGLQRGLVLGGPFEKAPRVAVAHDRAAGHRDHPVGRRQAALQAMLDQQYRRVGLLVEPAQLPDQLVARHGVQLRGRLVEQDQRRARDERGGERDPLQLAAGQLAGGAVQQVTDPEGQRGLLHPARDAAGAAGAQVLERQRELGADRVHDDLRLGILQQRAGHGADRGRGVIACVQSADDHVARKAAAVEVRDETGGGAQQRRLARPRQPHDDAELTGRHRQADIAQRILCPRRISIADALEGENAHGNHPGHADELSPAHPERRERSVLRVCWPISDR